MAKAKGDANIDSLKLDDKNFNLHTDEGMALIEKSIKENKFGRSVLVDKDNNVIAGNGVVETARKCGKKKIRVIDTTGDELVVVRRTDLAIDSKEGRALALADNQTSAVGLKWDEDMLKDEAAKFDISLADWGIEFHEPKLRGVSISKKTLVERFGIPPFSVFDSKQGYWQNRKREWLSLGIKSEIGRADNLTFNISANSTSVYSTRNALREKLGYDPSWEEVKTYCEAHNIKMLNTTSVFDPVLCEIAYKWFCPKKGEILDPFAGGSVRGVVAHYLGYNYTGVDLRPEQVSANFANAKEILNDGNIPTWICSDSQKIDEVVTGEFDFVFSCPPYADLEKYSDDERDLSNMDYSEFLEAYRTIIRKCFALLKSNRFACFVVGEVRGKGGAYYNFVPETIKAFLDAGFIYYNEICLLTSISSTAMRASRSLNKTRKVGKCHQNVLVFYKGDIKKIHDIYGDAEIMEVKDED